MSADNPNNPTVVVPHLYLVPTDASNTDPVADADPESADPESADPESGPERDRTGMAAALAVDLQTVISTVTDERDGWMHAAALADNEAYDLRKLMSEESNRHFGNLAREQGYARDARLELSRFQEQVRQIAVDAHLAGDFCKEGMNQAFRTLGLEEWEPSVEVEITVTVTATISGSDDADDAANSLWYAVESAVESIDYLSDGGDVQDITANLRRGW